MDFYGKKINVDNIDITNFKNEYIFGQCKQYSTNIPSEIVKSWIIDLISFQNKKGTAYECWPYKDDPNSINNTTYFFCSNQDIKWGISKINRL